MDEKQKEIITGTYEIMKQYGIRSISMDDIAQQLRVSKKTLYVYYANKTELLKDVLDFSVEQDDLSNRIDTRAYNAIDELLMVAELASDSMKDVNPVMLFDLNKYYPELSEYYFDKKTQNIYHQIIDNVTHGMTEGLYRDNINAELIALLYTERIKDLRQLCSCDTMKKFSFTEIVNQLVEGHIRGIANEKGIAYLEDKKQTDTSLNP